TIRNLLGEGTLAGSFIPVYAAFNERPDKSEARALAGAVLGLLLLAASALALVGIAAAPALVTVFGAGLQGQSRALAVALMRILFPMSGLMVISAWCLGVRSEEHTSELQSRFDLVCRLLLEKKKERWKRCISRLIQTIAPLVSVTCGIKMQL